MKLEGVHVPITNTHFHARHAEHHFDEVVIPLQMQSSVDWRQSICRGDV